MECEHTFEDVDFLLKRDWFLDTQDILQLFWELPEDIYLTVIENRRAYAPRIRDLLEFEPLPRPIVIRNVTETEVRAQEEHTRMEREVWMRAHRKAYIPPPRPREEMDDDVDAIRAFLATKREVLEDVTRFANKSRKYVPPSQRTAVETTDPLVRDAIADVTKLENELAKKTTILESINKTWTDLHWLDALHQDVVKRSLPSPSNVAVN